jgi:uncharacterized membrane protein
MTVDLLGCMTILVVGFTACAEFGSYAFVHPVIRRLPGTHHITVEQGLLRTFGRVMPPLMTLCVILLAINSTRSAADAGPALWRYSAAAAVDAAFASTIVVNVPINLATRRWDPAKPPETWQKTRRRWEGFQGLRSWLLLIGFVLTCVSVAIG